MKRLFLMLLLLILASLLLSPVLAAGDWIFDVEGGYAWPDYIDVRIPNDTGTLFSLKDDLPADSRAVYRLKLGYQFHPSHSITLLFAPLGLNAQGVVDKDISFNGDLFPAGTDLRAFYKFNSYRLTYRFDFVNAAKWKVGLGFTAKIRDAEVRLKTRTPC